MPNIEIKCRYPDLNKARDTALAMGARFLWKDSQVDTYFFTSKGKLKLRESKLNGSELLPYVKTSQADHKRSDYARIPVTEPVLVKKLFDELLGRKLEVRKEREVYLVGNVRVHLDQVQQLGAFLEFEAVFEEDTPAVVAAEQRKVTELMQKFDVKSEDLLDVSYPDLLAQTN